MLCLNEMFSLDLRFDVEEWNRFTSWVLDLLRNKKCEPLLTPKIGFYTFNTKYFISSYLNVFLLIKTLFRLLSIFV